MAAVIVGVAKVVGAIVGAIKTVGIVSTIAKFVVTTALSIGVSKLIAKRAMSGADAGGDGGGRIQLPPATDNKIPVVYGSAFIGGSIIDAMLSTDQKTMWYVVALAEHSDDQGGGGGNYTYDTTACYYDGKLIEFGANGRVTGLITNNANPLTAQKDTRVDGYLYVYLFTNGSASCQNAPSLTAYNILSLANGVPSGQQWTAGQQDMPNCAFAIIKVIYNTNAGVTSAGSLTAKITNTLTRPGDVAKDYMLNTRYGCAIPLDRIDTASLDALNDYSDELIDYIPTSGYGYDQQQRYRINGPIDTSQNCLDNLQRIVDSCDSWLQYSELTGLWRIVMNKGYDQYPNATTLNNLFLVDSSNLVGGIDISPLDLNETYNQIEVAYPNTYIKDQTDYQIIDLFEEDPTILSENEAVNRLNVTLPLVNNAVQARYLAARRIYQSREDLVVTFRLDFSGIQLEAGDVIRINHEVYGWTDKLFRVSTVAEEKDETGNLFAVIQAFEYNNDIYDDIVEDFRPSFNTGLLNPNVIDIPGTPSAVINPDTDGMISSFTLTSYVPNFGTVLYMDFNYGNTSNIQTHQLYRKVQTADGLPFTNSDTGNSSYSNVSIAINDLPAGTYYFSTVARNDIAGRVSLSSSSFFWTGANINPANIVTGNGVYSNGNMLYSNTPFSNLNANANVYLISGTGQLASNTYITNVANSTHFFVTPTPVIALNNANIEIISGGINGNVITPNTMPGNRVLGNSMNGNTIINGTLNGNAIIANTLNGNVIVAGTVTDLQIGQHTITANNIKANAIVANTIAAGAITTEKLAANAITANTIAANAITTDKLAANSIVAGKIAANAVTANTIAANAITAGTIAANAVTAGTIAAGAITAGSLAANSVTANEIAANAITAGKIAAGAVTANTIAANAVTANTIAANAVTAGTIAAGAVTANTIAANAVTAGTIAANSVDANALQAFSITGGKLAIGTIEAQNIKANTITFENLAIGAVTQAKSTTSDPIVKPVPFTNSNVWPTNTRCVLPAGGVTIIPTTDPNSSANTEYVEGSRIEVSYSVKMYVNPANIVIGSNTYTADMWNLVEIWKSGASSIYDRGINTIRGAFDLTGNATSAHNQQLHALGYAPGGLDLYSANGGYSWSTYNGNSTSQTITGAMSFATSTFTSYPRPVESDCVGPLQTISGTNIACLGSRVGSGAAPIIWSQNSGANAIRYQTASNGAGFTQGYTNDLLSMEMSPYTGGNGYPYVTGNAGYIFTGTNGDIFYSPTAFAVNENTTNAMRKENVPGLLKNLNSSYSNPASGGLYTAAICGQTGTILRSDRTVGASDYSLSWSSRPTYIGGNILKPVLTDLYSIAGDDTVPSGNNKWVAVGQYGMIQVSVDDAVSWNQVVANANLTADLNGVRYANGTWVAVGDNGTILTSTTPTVANSWMQIDTSNLKYTNGATFGSITGANNPNARILNTVYYSKEWDTITIGGQGIILYTPASNIDFRVAYQVNASETYDLTRVTYYGSGPNVANTYSSAPPDASQRILNNQIFSGTIVDTSYVAGQETTYYLVIGNMKQAQILAGQVYLQVTEVKR